jgi:hypothetical protein
MIAQMDRMKELMTVQYMGLLKDPRMERQMDIAMELQMVQK